MRAWMLGVLVILPGVGVGVGVHLTFEGQIRLLVELVDGVLKFSRPREKRGVQFGGEIDRVAG